MSNILRTAGIWLIIPIAFAVLFFLSVDRAYADRIYDTTTTEINLSDTVGYGGDEAQVFICNGSEYSICNRNGYGDIKLEWWNGHSYDTETDWSIEIETDGKATFENGAGTYSAEVTLDPGNNAWALVCVLSSNSAYKWHFEQFKLQEPTYVPQGGKIKYDGESHELITATSGDSGQRHYRYMKDSGAWSAWSTSVPAASDTGTYTIEWYSDYNIDNHSDSPKNWLKKGNDEEAAGTITTKILPAAKAPTLTGWSGTYDGSEHGVTAKDAEGGTINYRTSSDNETWGSWSPSAPKMKNAGVIYVQAQTIGDDEHADSDVTDAVMMNIAKAKQPMTVKTKAKKVKFKKVKKKAVKTAPLTVKKAQGKVTYKVVGGKAKAKKALKLNTKTGKITVKKRTKKGTYKIKIGVKAAGNVNYEAGSKSVWVKVRVK